ncbi:ferric reductase transmembrane component 4 [Fusarium langsethiae]|uniref:Ferric reductase transmembrane component 4 n=1 Tax=Fusarium langsethiae TaxID=179993 RepID=A0A0M9ELN9_FUSLA|nr:ferric reductase transmembrane component 4 [Fusarium langsethiae]
MIIESRYSITLVVIALGLPIVITWLGYMPYIPTIYDRLKPYMLYPSTIGTYSVRPLPFKLGNVPNMGQALFIVIFVSLTVVFTAIDYDVRQPNARFDSTRREQLAYLVYRTGSFAYALLPVIVLFPSRNNILLSLSNWSRSTFILLHRWVGRIFTLLAVLHAMFALAGSKSLGSTDWRRWGAATVILSVITTFGSGLYFRKANYELFLLMHVILAVFIVVGCWYHLIMRYEAIGMDFPNHSYGQEIWLYMACAIWFFERLVRIIRVVRLGILRSKVKDIGSGYVRIDIPHVRWGLDPGKHVFVYFPTLAPLRPWENHPFSVIPTVALRSHGSVSSPTSPISPGGGVGITSVFALAHSHWNVKLAWSVKEDARCLVNELEPAMDAISTVQVDVRVGSRFNVTALIDDEASRGWERVGIVVSGPGSLCDEVRAVVAGIARNSQTIFELEVDAYSW